MCLSRSTLVLLGVLICIIAEVSPMYSDFCYLCSRSVPEAAREGTGDAPPSDAPAPADPADIPLDRFFIRF